MKNKTLKEFDKRFGHFLTYNTEEQLITNLTIRDWLKHEVGKDKDERTKNKTTE